MNTSQMPSSYDARIEAAFGQPLAVLCSRAAAGVAAPEVQRALELRSFLAAVEGAAATVRDRIHEATRPQRHLYGLPGCDLKLHVDLLDEALDVGGTYGEELKTLLASEPSRVPLPVRPGPSSENKAASTSQGGVATGSYAVPEPAVEAGSGRHRR